MVVVEVRSGGNREEAVLSSGNGCPHTGSTVRDGGSPASHCSGEVESAVPAAWPRCLASLVLRAPACVQVQRKGAAVRCAFSLPPRASGLADADPCWARATVRSSGTFFILSPSRVQAGHSATREGLG